MHFASGLVLVAAVAATLVVLLYFVNPFVVCRRRMPGRPTMRRFELSEVDRVSAEYLAAHAADLLALGFDEPTHFTASELGGVATSFFILAVDRTAGTVGSVAVTLYGPQKSRRLARVAFTNRTDADEQLVTHNLDVPLVFHRPEAVTLQVPGVAAAADLLNLHRAALARQPQAGRPLVYPPGGEAEYLRTFYFRQTYDEGVRRGFLWHDAVNDEYRFTLHGAFVVTWANLLPLKPILAAPPPPRGATDPGGVRRRPRRPPLTPAQEQTPLQREKRRVLTKYGGAIYGLTRVDSIGELDKQVRVCGIREIFR